VTGWLVTGVVVLGIGGPLAWKLAFQSEANRAAEVCKPSAAIPSPPPGTPAEPVSRVTTTGAFVPMAGLRSAPTEIQFPPPSSAAASALPAPSPSTSTAKPAKRAARPYRATDDEDNPYDDRATTHAAAARPKPTASAPSDPFAPRE
jgi:hypothetical protein